VDGALTATTQGHAKLSQQASDRLWYDPPAAAWKPGPADPSRLAELLACLSRTAAELGTPPPLPGGPIILSGHQPWHWHPGILIKDTSALAVASRHAGCAAHLVVDQDVHPALRVDVPWARDGTLSARTLVLGPQLEGVPLGMQPPIDSHAAARHLEQAAAEKPACDLKPLIDAWRDLPPVGTLAQQVSVVLHRLRERLGVGLPICMATQLATMDSFRAMVEAMLRDAAACVRAYNQAVDAHPAAGMAGLRVDSLRIELPLWRLAWQQPRQRVFADVADRLPRLVDERGEVIDWQANDPRDHLAPRALLMTALLRRGACGLFVHGRGGALYDRITEQWIERWLGVPLNPMAAASCDVRLPFDVPVATDADLARAVWWNHHLPHNLDRHLPPGRFDAAVVHRKRELLATLSTDGDRTGRAAAFRELHTLNDKLAAAAPDALAAARLALLRARQGVANADLALRRDWCFALYPEDRLAALPAPAGVDPRT
jgi:hypothetical protein